MYKINNAEVGSAVSIRPSATALFTVNSADRYGTIADKRDATVLISPYDFTIRKKESLLNGFFTRMGITEISFPFALPNVGGSTTKLGVTKIISGVPTTTVLTFDATFYTPSEFAAELQTEIRTLDAALAAATVVYSPTGKPQFYIDTQSAIAELSFLPVAQSPSAFPYPPEQIQVYDMLGMSALNHSTGAPNFAQGVFISSPTFFQKYQYLDIVSTLLTGNQNLKDSTSSAIDRNILCRLYIDYENSYNVPASDPLFAPAGTTPITIYRKFPVPKFVQWDVKQPIGQLNFQVYDQNGVLLPDSPSTANMDWKMSVLVSEQ
jgi:hypothetical protein